MTKTTLELEIETETSKIKVPVGNNGEFLVVDIKGFWENTNKINIVDDDNNSTPSRIVSLTDNGIYCIIPEKLIPKPKIKVTGVKVKRESRRKKNGN